MPLDCFFSLHNIFFYPARGGKGKNCIFCNRWMNIGGGGGKGVAGAAIATDISQAASFIAAYVYMTKKYLCFGLLRNTNGMEKNSKR